MKTLMFAFGIVTSATVAAQPLPTTTAPPPAAKTAPATVAALNADTPIETLMARPETKAILLKYVPEIENHPAYEQFKTMSLRQLQPLAGGLITDEKIAGMEADLKKLK